MIEGDHFLSTHLATYKRAARRCAGVRVLDIGCGFGWGAAILAERAKTVVGVDIAADRIEAARGAGFPRNVTFSHIGDDSELTKAFIDDSLFSRVCLVQVIQHVPDPQRLLTSARRLTTGDGQVFLAVKPAGHFAGLTFDGLVSAMLDLAARAGLQAVSIRRPRRVLPTYQAAHSNPTIVEGWFCGGD